ncbi:MAG TPA: basic amino acid ABC transporter substrate-binding protein [Candidatus Aphodousia faecigallinarum]|uniref:Basic amino acid ABC transporter substrate-binding protein n=1 Tax=Candidatus Aphodousia faecigallinarum TaxID=2840677 RepID=A0A9D1IGK8_9BURK|nr:basic amino acid ABC transporter substrate-binding protein [Candidatus Aphodousia faecigallinarum]
MKKLLTVLATAAIFATGAKAATILVGTDAGYAPYEYKDPKTNEIVGFDIDLIKAVAKATGNEAKIQNMQFAGIIPALQANMIDVAAAGMTITPERQKQVSFSDPYYDVGGLIMAVHSKNVDKYKHMNDLEGKRVCAQIGSTGALLAKEIKDAKLVAFDQTGEAFMELKMGGCEAVLVDKIVTEFYLAHRAEKDIVLVPHLYTHKQNGFAIAKGNEKMLKTINDGLKAIRASGEYDKIYAKWFGKAPEKK